MKKEEFDKRIEALPQARMISEPNRERFWSFIRTLPESEQEFHVGRLRGFGGSDLGPLLAEADGERDDFSTAREVVMQKLCMMLPEPANEHMLAGTYFEDVSIRVILDKFGLTLDEEAMQAVSDYDPQGDWQVGNTDLIATDQKSHRYLFDVKMPTELPERTDPVKPRYQAQVESYRGICEKVGVEIDGIFIANCGFEGSRQFAKLIAGAGGDATDAGRALIKQISDSLFDQYLQSGRDTDTGPFRVALQRVPALGEMQEAIRRVGDRYWSEFVLKGKLPDWPRRAVRPLLQEEVARMRGLEYRAIFFDALAKKAKEAKDDLAKETARIGADREGDLPLEVSNLRETKRLDVDKALDFARRTGRMSGDDAFTVPAKYDTEKMLEWIKKAGGDVNQFVTGTKIDQAALCEALGEDAQQFYKSSYSLSASRRKAAKPRVEALQEEVGKVLVYLDDLVQKEFGADSGAVDKVGAGDEAGPVSTKQAGPATTA